MRKLFNHIILIFIYFLLTGCGASLNIKSMVPNMPSTKSYDFSINVASVTGETGHIDKLHYIRIFDVKSITLQETIIEALNKSKLFPAGTTNPNSKYILNTSILFQDVYIDHEFGANIYILILNYTLKDRKTNRVIYTSQFTSACGKDYYYYKSAECSVKDNLSRFITDLGKNLQSQNNLSYITD